MLVERKTLISKIPKWTHSPTVIHTLQCYISYDSDQLSDIFVQGKHNQIWPHKFIKHYQWRVFTIEKWLSVAIQFSVSFLNISTTIKCMVRCVMQTYIDIGYTLKVRHFYFSYNFTDTKPHCSYVYSYSKTHSYIQAKHVLTGALE